MKNKNLERQFITRFVIFNKRANVYHFGGTHFCGVRYLLDAQTYEKEASAKRVITAILKVPMWSNAPRYDRNDYEIRTCKIQREIQE